MFAIFVDAPANAHFFQALDGFPVTVCPVAFRSENNFLVFLGHFQVLFAQFFAAGQAGTDGLTLFFRLEVVHVARAASVAEGLASIAFLVETVAQDGRFARAQQTLLETNFARFRTANGKFTEWRQMALVGRRARRSGRSAIDSFVAGQV